MTKQEVIKTEWLRLGFEPEQVEDNGFCDYYALPTDFDLHQFDCIYSYDKEDIIKVRPKSLQGIENNNGWIKIESEADLPKKSCSCWIEVDELEINTPFWYNHDTTQFYFKHIIYTISEVTHYQPINKPLKPLY